MSPTVMVLVAMLPIDNFWSVTGNFLVDRDEKHSRKKIEREKAFSNGTMVWTRKLCIAKANFVILMLVGYS
jgi:hypothetical protein